MVTKPNDSYWIVIVDSYCGSQSLVWFIVVYKSYVTVVHCGLL